LQILDKLGPKVNTSNFWTDEELEARENIDELEAP